METAVLNVKNGSARDAFCSFPSGQYPKVSIGILVDRTNLASQPRKEDESGLVTDEKMCTKENRTEPECTKHHIGLVEGVQKKGEDNKEKCADLPNVEVAHDSAWESCMLDKELEAREKAEDMCNINDKSLRLKLWEILGGGESQNKQVSSPKVLKVVASIPHTEKICKHQNLKTAETKQKSDTIETDSENPKNSMRRPITRSVTRNKDIKQPVSNLSKISSARLQLSSTLPGHKQNVADQNVFSFDEKFGKTGGSKWSTNNTSSKGIRNRCNRKACKIERRRISFPRKSVSERVVESSEKDQPLLVSGVRKIDNIVEGTYSSQQKMKEYTFHQSNAIYEKLFRNPGKKVHILHKSNAIYDKLSQNAETRQKLNLNTPSLEKYMNTHESDSHSKTNTDHPKSTSRVPLLVVKNIHVNIDDLPSSRSTEPIHNFQSPTLAVNITSTSEKVIPSGQVHCSNSQKENPSDSVSLLSSRLKFSDSDAYVGNHNHMYESSFDETQHLNKNKSEEMHLSQSHKMSDDDNSEADDVSNQGTREEKWSPKTCTNVEFSIPSHHSKGFNSLGCNERRQSEETQYQLSEEELPRAISQLALLLEQFKAKIKSYTSNKNSQILSSFGDRIRLNLQEVEHQIQEDMREFVRLAKLKRKRLESTFQEKQEKMKIIHEKFKQEVNQHLLDCRGTLEELESFQMEIKTSAELRKGSHRKLLTQVEEETEAQLRDAEINIATIHKVARKRMDDLKHAIKELLSKGLS